MKRKAFWLGGALVVALVAGCESTGAARTSERVELRAAYRPTTGDAELSVSCVVESGD
ncbi:MAG: hypothetical protein J6K25_08040 [Thermoguttaceae bacterium]|nr:hypothetical protein [Thermoguttaceae bacterium]